MNWLGIATITGVGGVVTWACITYAAWPQLIVFWLAVAAMVYYQKKSNDR